jgi:cyanophycinase-like exopeptidase
VTGRLVLMGSGEIAPTMVATHRAAIAAAGAGAVTLLDSPYGFQENADELTERIVAFFRTSLAAVVEVARLRSVEEDVVSRERAVAVVAHSRYVFAGPGSPSYALRVWEAAGMAEALRAVIARGGSVTLASAAALTAGVVTLPVYEIYKVGADPYWLPGLDLTSGFGLPLVAVPHWNNAEGGTHDTSRCYVGERRLALLERELETGILGIDEHTAATIDFGAGTLGVSGASTVTVRGLKEIVVESGDRVGLDRVAAVLAGPRTVPPPPVPSPHVDGFESALERGDVDAVLAAMLDAESDPDRSRELRAMIVELGEAARTGLVDPRQVVAGFVDLLLELRAGARTERRFEESDLIRSRLGDLGVEVRDTPAGADWSLREA